MNKRRMFYRVEDGVVKSRRAIHSREEEFLTAEEAEATIQQPVAEDREDTTLRRLEDDTPPEEDTEIMVEPEYTVKVIGLNKPTIHTSVMAADNPDHALQQALEDLHELIYSFREYQVVEISNATQKWSCAVEGENSTICLDPNKALYAQYLEYRQSVSFRKWNDTERAFWREHNIQACEEQRLLRRDAAEKAKKAAKRDMYRKQRSEAIKARKRHRKNKKAYPR